MLKMTEKATQSLKSKKLGNQWLEIPFPALKSRFPP